MDDSRQPQKLPDRVACDYCCKIALKTGRGVDERLLTVLHT